jgi:pyruvate formate lyase activating enzyme
MEPDEVKIKIKAFIKNSLLDWDGKIVSVVYLPECNFRCPFCQNVDLILSANNLKTIEFKEIVAYLDRSKIFIDGVCITGGEPCLYDDLSQLLQRFKSLGFLVKLDTNGSYPRRLQEIINSKLVDYIAMDIKAPLEESRYLEACGIQKNQILYEIKKSMSIIMNSYIDYEFRVTVVPTLHTKREILQIAKSIRGAKKLALQNFSNHKTLNPEFERIKPYSIKQLEEMAESLKDYVGECVVRGGS